MSTPYRVTTTFWDHATIWSDDESLAGHSTDGGRVFGVTRTRYVECDHYGCSAVVVIDPEDREQVERLEAVYRAAIDSARPGSLVDVMQAALHEFANPTPIMPDEPTGLGAVVQADNGTKFVRMFSHDVAGNVWRRSGDKAEFRAATLNYGDLNAVRVLSEGVTP